MDRSEIREVEQLVLASPVGRYLLLVGETPTRTGLYAHFRLPIGDPSIQVTYDPAGSSPEAVATEIVRLARARLPAGFER